MTEESTFIDELIADAEANEQKQTLAYFDLLVAEISKLEEEVSHNFRQAEDEAKIIHDWALKRNSSIQEKIDRLKLKLEAFIREQNKKTIDLPHGILKIRKMPDKVEISDMEAFLKNASQALITVVPETIKPNLVKIKASIKKTTRVPEGVSVTEGKDEFKLTLKTKEVTYDSKSKT